MTRPRSWPPTDAELTALAKELGITYGSYSARIVGDRIEFHCLGGPVVVYEPERKKRQAAANERPEGA